MRILTRRLSTLLAAAAGLALVAGFSGAANAADDPVSTLLNYLTSPPSPVPQTTDQYSPLYPDYNPNANLGQGSGNAGAFGR